MTSATQAGAAPGDVLVRFVSSSHSVRAARQLVGDTLRAWGRDALVDDARLVVTELTTNATLHSGAPSFCVAVTATADRGVRIAVGDEGSVPAAAVVPRRHRAAAPGVRPEAVTGRGLAIVDELAHAWGVSVDAQTKWVWAQLPAGDGADDPADASEAVPGAAGGPPALPPGWHAVRLVRCPVQLGLAHDDHLDELVRELQLVDAPAPEPELAGVIRGLLDGQAQARHVGRRTAQDAAAQGREHVDVEMLLPTAAAEQVEQLDEAVRAADAMCERAQLLTMASPPAVRQLRRWMRDEVRDQIRGARTPLPYDAFVAGAGAEQSRTA